MKSTQIKPLVLKTPKAVTPSFAKPSVINGRPPSAKTASRRLTADAHKEMGTGFKHQGGTNGSEW